MNILYIFLVLFFNLNFAVVENKININESDFNFRRLSEEIRNEKYKDFFNKKYFEENFQKFGSIFISKINNNYCLNKNNIFFLVSDRAEKNIFNVALLFKKEKNEFYLDYIENNNSFSFSDIKKNKRPGYRNIKKIINFCNKKQGKEIGLIAINNKLVKYYKKLGFEEIDEYEMVLDLEKYRKNKIEKLKSKK